MEKHHTLSDSAFEQQFADGTLDPTLFTHEAHLRLAWIHVTRYGIAQAIDHVCTQIRAFATAHGDKDKYNTTVTVAATRAVYHFVRKSSSSTFAEFIQEFPRLKHSFRELLDAHYDVDIFQSQLARETFLEPDRAPFDPIPV